MEYAPMMSILALSLLLAATPLAMGKAFAERGKDIEAQKYLEQAMEMLRKPSDLPGEKRNVLADLGYALTRDKKPGEARMVLAKSIAKDPASADAEYSLGDACAADGALPEARAAYERAIALEP